MGDHSRVGPGCCSYKYRKIKDASGKEKKWYQYTVLQSKQFPGLEYFEILNGRKTLETTEILRVLGN